MIAAKYTGRVSYPLLVINLLFVVCYEKKRMLRQQVL